MEAVGAPEYAARKTIKGISGRKLQAEICNM
jgi:hypothetical protein